MGASQEDGDGDATQMRTYRGMKCIHYSAKLFSYLFTFLFNFFPTLGAEGVINRLGTQQSKWKRQVQEQRRNIYDRHSMLN